MKYSLKYPKVAFNILLEKEPYLNLKRDFHLQANSIDPKDDNIIWVNEFDTKNRDDFFDDNGPPEEVKKHFIDDFIIVLVDKAKILFIDGVLKMLNEKETQGKTAVLVLNKRFKDYLKYYYISLKKQNHLPNKVKLEIKDALNEIDSFIDRELSINVFKDYSKNKIRLKMNAQEVCIFMLFLDAKGLIGGDASRTKLIELIESHFMYFSGVTKNYEEIYSAKNTISNIINSKNRNVYSEKLEKLLIDFNKVFDELRVKK